jgi:hypothetical protein
MGATSAPSNSQSSSQAALNAPGWAKANLPAPDPNGWEADLLQKINAPVTPTTVSILDAWANSENTLGQNNPLAISGVYSGATSCIAQCGTNSPIMTYSSWQAGNTATANFIKASPEYSIIIQDLQASTPNDSNAQALSIAQAVFTNINGSGWCKGCQGGVYPTALNQLISEWDNFSASAKGGVTPTSITGIAGDYAGAATGGLSNWTSSLTTLLSAITSKSFWTRVGFGFLGFALVGVGLIFLLSQTKTGQTAEKGIAMGAIA